MRAMDSIQRRRSRGAVWFHSGRAGDRRRDTRGSADDRGPAFANNTSRAKTRSCQSNLRAIDGAIQAYAAEKKKNPGAIADLVPEHLRKIPRCPVDRLHQYSLIGDSGDPPVQTRVLCGDANGRGGVEDTDHFN